VETGEGASYSAADPVPLSILALDLGGVPAEGWPSFLGRRAIPIIPDSLRRDSVSHSHARQLLDEQRADVLRRRAAARVQEQELVEADQLRRASIWKGLPADQLPAGAHPASVMLAAAKAARPRRRSVLEDSLSNSGTVYHPIQHAADES
jgi:hypothetical protein